MTIDTFTAKTSFGGLESRTATITIDVVASSGGTEPLSHFLLNENAGATTAVDDKGVQNAIIRGEPYMQQSPLKGADNGMAFWGGPEVIEIPNNTAYNLSGATFAISVQPVSEPEAEARHSDQIIANRERYFVNQPGAFIIKRKNGLLEVGVRNSTGTMQWAGGGSGISGATLPLGTGKLIGVTFGSAGAKVYLNGTKVGNTLSTSGWLGWTGLNTKIFVGRGYLGDEPFWGVMDDIRIYDTQLSDAEMSTLGSASSVTADYGTPTKPPGTLRYIEDFGGSLGSGNNSTAIINAMNAGSGTNVVSSRDNPTVWDSTTGKLVSGGQFLYTSGDNFEVPPGVSFWQINLGKNPSTSKFNRMTEFGSPDSLDRNTNPHYVRECIFDGRQDQISGWPNSFAQEQQHAIFAKNSNESDSLRHRVFVDHTVLKDVAGDGISAGAGTHFTINRLVCISCFRGGEVINEGNTLYESKNGKSIDGDYGCGYDVEIFPTFSPPSTVTFDNIWAESDLDFNGGGGNGNADRATGSVTVNNFAATRGGFNMINNGTNSTGSTITFRNSIVRLGNTSGQSSEGSRVIQPSATIFFEDTIMVWSDKPHKKHPGNNNTPPNDRGIVSPLRCNINWSGQPGLFRCNRVKMTRDRDTTGSVNLRSSVNCNMFTTSGSPTSSMIYRFQNVEVDDTINQMNHGGARMEHDDFTFFSGGNAFTGSGQQVAI